MGEFVRLDVDKNSSVYRYFIEYPDTDTGLASNKWCYTQWCKLTPNNGQTNYGSGNQVLQEAQDIKVHLFNQQVRPD